ELEIERDVFVDQDVAESGERLESPHQLGREAWVAGEAPHRFRVVLEPLAAPGGELARDVDHELANGEEGEEDVVVQRKVATQVFRGGHPRAQLLEMVEMAAKLDEPLDEPGQRASASSFTRRVRRRNGSRSAARSWTSLRNAWS